MNGTITMMQALQVTGVCMGIVFVTLLVISLMIDANKFFINGPGGKKNDAIKKSATAPSHSDASSAKGLGRGNNGKRPEELTEEDEIAVALVAAIEASEGNENAKVKVIAVREMEA